MTETEEPTLSQPKAGAILKQLRDKKNLSIQEVASQLRLDPQIIEALEQDNYEKFAADTYIRGYLRSYAKLIGVDGNEIISLYSPAAKEPPEIIPDVKHPTQVSSSDKPVKAFTYLVTFILVLLLLIWWWQSNFSINRNIIITSPVKQEPTTTVETPVEQISPASDLPPEILDSIPGLEPEDPGILPADPIQPPVEPVATIPDSSIMTATTAIDGETTQTTGPAAAAGTEIVDNKAGPGPDTIYLKMNADCWIEIFDRFNKEVYLNLARTGDEVYLNGNAPFDVKLGNAQGVVLEFNNKQFDPAPYTSRGIARFTLGE